MYKWKKSNLPVIGLLALILIAGILLCFKSINSNQAVGAVAAQVRFEGEYRIEDGQWQEIIEGKHIPATQGDVTLRGNFCLYSPDGEYIGAFGGDVPIAFYTDHINLTFCESDNENYVIDHENPLFGDFACGVDWTAHSFSGNGTEPIEIIVHNPHSFGNDLAIDKMLSGLAIWGSIDFEREILESGKMQRYTGMVFLIVSIALIGSALFSGLLHIPNNRIIWMLGVTILSASIYLIYSASGVSFWNYLIVINTIVLGCSMMFYMLLVSGLITYFIRKTKRIGYVTTAILGIIDGLCFLIPMMTKIRFYDIWLPWTVAQSMANIILFVCLIKEFVSLNKKERWISVGLAALVFAFQTDVIATAAGIWQGGLISKYVFYALAAIALFIVLRIIPENINAATKAKELEAEKNRVEAELKENRISLMLSQIQPHFIYNTLGTIERMCLKNPEKAFELVRNFSLYLRGNFSELDSVAPISFEEELKHIEYYVNIEKVRFPDMNIEYEIKTTDFLLPALSVQPLVENAIKHGLMRLETGGTILIHAYETSTHFCVEVKDDGVGFDTSLPIEGKKHVGLRNIRGRLKAMVNGELILESQQGVGTNAMIMIPKDVTV